MSARSWQLRSIWPTGCGSKRTSLRAPARRQNTESGGGGDFPSSRRPVGRRTTDAATSFPHPRDCSILYMAFSALRSIWQHAGPGGPTRGHGDSSPCQGSGAVEETGAGAPARPVPPSAAGHPQPETECHGPGSNDGVSVSRHVGSVPRRRCTCSRIGCETKFRWALAARSVLSQLQVRPAATSLTAGLGRRSTAIKSGPPPSGMRSTRPSAPPARNPWPAWAGSIPAP